MKIVKTTFFMKNIIKTIIDDSIAKVVIKVWKTLESFPITTLPIA